MPNITTLFPAETTFGSTAGTVATWAEGNNTGDIKIPTALLPDLSIAHVFVFDNTASGSGSADTAQTAAEALNSFIAAFDETGQGMLRSDDRSRPIDAGDLIIIQYVSTAETSLGAGDEVNSVVQFIYTGSQVAAEGTTVASDYTNLAAGGVSGVAAVAGGVGINAEGTSNVTINNDLNIELNGTAVNTGFLSAVNFSNAFTVTAQSDDATQINIGFNNQAPGAYTVTATSAANTNQMLQPNAVRVIPGSTQAVTYTLPSTPAVGTWVKIANLSGQAGTTIARNGQPIQGSTTDLVLNDTTANFELIYIDATTGWIVMGAN